MKLTLVGIENETLAEIALLDVDPAPEDPEEGYFTTLDIVPHDGMSVEDWTDFLEGLAVTNEDGELLVPDHGDIYLERLARVFRGPYLNSVLE